MYTPTGLLFDNLADVGSAFVVFEVLTVLLVMLISILDHERLIAVWKIALYNGSIVSSLMERVQLHHQECLLECSQRDLIL